MTLETLEEAFKYADASDSIADHLAFKKLLLSSDEPSVVEYHFELLARTTNEHLHDTLARFFKWRGESGESFLLARIDDETDAKLLATALQILGTMRSDGAAGLARAHLSHPEAVVRERAVLVLGWVGSPEDLETLGRIQLEESEPDTRSWAASQQMHIWLRHPDATKRVLKNLSRALAAESAPEVLAAIVLTAQTVMKRRFGLREERGTRRILGELEKAVAKTAAAVAEALDP